jgi:para-nitrobenzyl esterase
MRGAAAIAALSVAAPALATAAGPVASTAAGKVRGAMDGAVAAEAQTVADAMSSAWINFARSGDPNGKGAPAWKPYDTAAEPVMAFDVTSRMVSDAAPGRRAILRGLPPMLTPGASPPKA